MKILAVCGHGLGSSLMLSLNIKKALTNLNITADVNHIDLSSVNQSMADIFICSKDLQNSLNLQNVVGVNNILDVNEITTALQQFLQNKS